MISEIRIGYTTENHPNDRLFLEIPEIAYRATGRHEKGSNDEWVEFLQFCREEIERISPEHLTKLDQLIASKS